MKRIAHALLLTVLLSPAACDAAPPAPATIMAKLPDGRRLAFTCQGRGAPTIVLEGGWGGGRDGWGAVPGSLAARYRVCAYDRAGHGLSDVGPLPRDGTAIARDLDAGLRAAKIAAPFVLVGHSAGGLYIRHFLLRRRADVVGMVFVDATVPDQKARFEAAFGPGAGSLDGLIAKSRACAAAAHAEQPGGGDCGEDPPARRAGWWDTSTSELETLLGTTASRLAHDDRVIGALPIITLTAQRTYEGPGAPLWISLHEELARRSTRGEARQVDSGHGVMWEKPDAIVQAVDDVVARGRAK